MGWQISRSVLPQDHICHFAKCSICFDFIRDPIQCRKCQNHYCKDCIDEWKNRRPHCPNGCDPTSYKEGHRLMKNIIGDILLFCKYKSSGCTQSCKIKDIEKHESRCQYYLVSCPYQGCDQVLPAALLKQHKIQCPLWKWTCPRSCGFETHDRGELELHDCDIYTKKMEQIFQEREKKFKEEKQEGSEEHFELIKEIGQFRLRMKLLEIRETHFPEEKKSGFKTDL